MPETLEDPYFDLRRKMVEQIALHARFVGDETRRAALDERVLSVVGDVPRHEFVPSELRSFAYMDTPLPIGYGKTISQPFIVALMTDLLDVGPEHVVLEIGTGLGYQSAILARLARAVYTIEVIEELARGAQRRLREQGCENVVFELGDGSAGWPAHSPYDRIIVTAAPDLIPAPLLHQLKAGGKMIIPAGIQDAQQLMYVEKDEAGRISTREVLAVRFSELVVGDPE